MIWSAPVWNKTDMIRSPHTKCSFLLTCGRCLRIVLHKCRCSLGFSSALADVDDGLDGVGVILRRPLPLGRSLFAGNGFVRTNADELCSRVFTTSRGHVSTAPTVPAILQTRERNMSFFGLVYYEFQRENIG